MNLTSTYNLNAEEIQTLQSAITEFLNRHGVEVVMRSLEPVIETALYGEVYRVERAVQQDDSHHETCVSDGLTVWAHDEIEQLGGECSRLYDLLHVGCGHLFQWAAGAESGLEFYGDEAWSMASTFYLRAEERLIDRVWRYEREAAQLANGNLDRILDEWQFSSEFKKNVARMFNDYAVTDLAYITAYYRTGEVCSIFDKWSRNADRIPPIPVTFAVRPSRRTNRCVALLRHADP
jgi:hypothetical protein